MDCGKTRALLAAYHDGELAADDRARVDAHLRGCGECSAILARLTRVDANVDVPDPGAAYWERFNRRVMDRLENEAAPAGVSRPKRGWRRRLPYFIPAVAAAALLFVVVRQTGTDPFSRTAAPPAPASAPQLSAQEPRRDAAEYPAAAGASSAPRSAREAGEAHPSPPAPLSETLRNEEAVPLPRAGAPEKEAPVPGAREEKAFSETGADRALSKSMAAAAPTADARATAALPCREARLLADRGRLEEAESAQRACLARENRPEAREAGMLLLAELLDRQSRFAEADSVLEETRRLFPASRPLDAYLLRRSREQEGR